MIAPIMLLHEAVKKARKDLGMSQKELAELAGVQRKQLGILENGGNVTLSTLRKVLAHLPNLETFTLEAVTATVRRYIPPEETQKALASAMALMGTALQNLVTALGEGRLPDDSAMSGLHKANEVLYAGIGYSPEDLERKLREAETGMPEQVPITEENAAAALAVLMDAAQGDIAGKLAALAQADQYVDEEDLGEDGDDVDGGAVDGDKSR